MIFYKSDSEKYGGMIRVYIHVSSKFILANSKYTINIRPIVRIVHIFGNKTII